MEMEMGHPLGVSLTAAEALKQAREVPVICRSSGTTRGCAGALLRTCQYMPVWAWVRRKAIFTAPRLYFQHLIRSDLLRLVKSAKSASTQLVS